MADSDARTWDGLTASARAGELWLADGAGAACVAACDEFIAELERRALVIGKLRNRGGFGGFESAQQLQAGFQRKAIEAHDRILEYKAVVERMRETFQAPTTHTGQPNTRTATASRVRIRSSADDPHGYRISCAGKHRRRGLRELRRGRAR